MSLMYSEEELRGRSVWILGMGKSGISAARLLRHYDAKVFVTELRNSDKVSEEIIQLEKLGVEYETGGHTIEGRRLPDFAVISPGIPPHIPLVQWLVENGRPVISEIELASWFFFGTIVAITGSNGKTTTTAWLTHILREAGIDAVAAGNIGYPFCDLILDNRRATHAVVEVSSYQLESILGFRPHVSIITNLSPDHLERHGNMEAYAQAKAQIWKNQDDKDFTIIPANDKLIATVATSIKPQKLFIHLDECPDFGAGIEDGWLKLNLGKGAENIARLEDLPIPGMHNAANALQAMAAARLLLMTPEQIKHGLLSFPGVAHRMEKVSDNGLIWINDSKSTNVDSLKVALEALESPVWLIAGGQDKGAPYEPLNDLLKSRVEKLLLIGEATEKMKKAWGSIVEFIECQTLDNAVKIASQQAPEGRTILLSPACASFDQFKNFEARGDHFRKLVGGEKQ